MHFGYLVDLNFSFKAQYKFVLSKKLKVALLSLYPILNSVAYLLCALLVE